MIGYGRCRDFEYMNPANSLNSDKRKAQSAAASDASAKRRRLENGSDHHGLQEMSSSDFMVRLRTKFVSISLFVTLAEYSGSGCARGCANATRATRIIQLVQSLCHRGLA